MKRFLLVALGAWLIAVAGAAEPVTLLNASYDVTSDKDYNVAFAAHWSKTTGQRITVNQSLDIDQLVQPGLIPADWAERLPRRSAPYTSTLLFVVRAGNPKGIKDWSDLVRPDVKAVIPNPKTSGNGRRRPGTGCEALFSPARFRGAGEVCRPVQDAAAVPGRGDRRWLDRGSAHALRRWRGV